MQTVSKLGINIAVSKSGLLMMFLDKPVRQGNTWTGRYYVNSVVQKEIEEIIKDCDFTFDREPEYLEIQFTCK